MAEGRKIGILLIFILLITDTFIGSSSYNGTRNWIEHAFSFFGTYFGCTHFAPIKFMICNLICSCRHHFLFARLLNNHTFRSVALAYCTTAIYSYLAPSYYIY